MNGERYIFCLYVIVSGVVILSEKELTFEVRENGL